MPPTAREAGSVERVESEFPVTRVAGRERRWYRGDCHIHSVHSDGELTPQQLAVGARAAGLDFIATTDHNTGVDASLNNLADKPD